MIERLVYNVREVSQMLDCSIPTAYAKIKGMNTEYAQKNKKRTVAN